MSTTKEPRYIRGHYSQGQKESTAKYHAKAYDEIKVRVKKGKKALIQKCAERQGMSTNAFIIQAIEESAQKVGFDLTVPEEKDK